MSPTPTYKRVPLRFAALLQTEPWYHSDYARLLESHREDDLKTGVTCVYNIKRDPQRGNITHVLGKEFEHDGWVNQHALHSLQLAIWECQKAFAEHEKRLELLLGTAQGRICRGEKS